ncbi:MAG: protein kinase, partial [Anaerolineae bacterium]|nr:protein kinase [Anaerolineae bacterium]
MFNLVGKTLGKYRLVEKLGQGGMAQVYKAYQPDLDRYVAIKILHPHLTGDEDFAARFRREARVVAALEHPHIVRIYDFDTDAEMAFLVMEHLEGGSLKSHLHDLEYRMGLEEVGRIVGALAGAFDYAHHQGVIHRDVKPSNVFITASGRPVLTDFGIARMVNTATITESGGTLGTPAYMSPEQCRGESGDARSDIYALGVLLYQLCVGRVPFDADTPYAIILKHITAPLPLPRSICPDLPEIVERVILKALAKDPDDRFQTAGDMGRALHVALEASAPPPPRHNTLRRAPDAAGGWLQAVLSFLRSRRVLSLVALITATIVICLLLLLATRPFRIRRFLVRLTPTVLPATGQATLDIAGPDVVDDTWLNPDMPNDAWHEADLVHLQGPLTPDRLLLRFDLTDLPADATIVSATLTMRVELWGEQSFPGAAVVYRVLTPWDPTTATYNMPWSAPGLAAGVDYDFTPLAVVPVPDVEQLTFDVSRAL